MHGLVCQALVRPEGDPPTAAFIGSGRRNHEFALGPRGPFAQRPLTILVLFALASTSEAQKGGLTHFFCEYIRV